jgi:hypothetical protein
MLCYMCGSKLCYLHGSKLFYIMLCVVANYVMCVIANYIDTFDSIEFATTHVAFLVNICVATKNATCVFVILITNYIGVFDNKLS